MLDRFDPNIESGESLLSILAAVAIAALVGAWVGFVIVFICGGLQ